MTTKQDVARYSQILAGILNDSFNALQQKKYQDQLNALPDQFNQYSPGQMNVPMTPGGPGVPTPVPVQTGFDQAGYIQALARLVGSNPGALPQLQAQMAIAPKPFTAGPDTVFGVRDPVTGKPTIQGAVPGRQPQRNIDISSVKDPAQKARLWNAQNPGFDLPSSAFEDQSPDWSNVSVQATNKDGKPALTAIERNKYTGEYRTRDLGQEQFRATSSKKDMMEVVAPSVAWNAQNAISSLAKPGMAAKIGALAGRWSDFATGKLGVSDPDLAELQTALRLTGTALMRMHTGARGSNLLFDEFQNLVAASQAPANLERNLDYILRYAKHVANTGDTETDASKVVGEQGGGSPFKIIEVK